MRLHPVPLALATIFAGVIAINISMVCFAVASAPGFVTDRPFEQGKAYNNDLAAAQAQQALGWTATIDIAEGVATVRLAASGGRPLEGLSRVAISAARPVGPTPDHVATPVEIAPGLYRAALDLPKGQWHIEVAAARGSDTFRTGTRVVVK